jgi:HAE1 family hydrophobic/amphiphilic exporter-1
LLDPKPQPGVVAFFRTLVTRPVAVLMATLALAGMAWIAAERVPIEMMPSGLSDTSINVRADWEGALPSEIEERVLKPLERELRTVQGIEEILSIASPGSAEVMIQFPGTVDMDLAYAEVADRLERARAALPPEVDRLQTFRWDPSAMPVMWTALVIPPTMPRETAQDLVTDLIVPRIEAVDGVAQAATWGLEPLSVRIWLDEERVLGNRVDVGDLVRRLQGDNLSGPAGDLEESGGRYLVRVDGRFETLQEIEEFPIRPGLLVRDVGRVEQVRSAPEFFFRVDGSFTLSLAVRKETSANTFALCAELKRLYEEELRADPRLGGITFVTYFNQGDMIGGAIGGLVNDTLLGGGIAIAILWLFLRRLSYTLLITLSIPFAVLLTLAWLWFSGGSLNLMTMMGITISIGMLVDCAVVVAEAIFKRREQGDDTLHSVTAGPAEVMLAIVTSTATTIAVFLPFMFLTEDRNSRVFSLAIGGPLCIALAASLLIAIVMVPVAARYLQHRGARSPAAAAAGRAPGWIARSFTTSLRWSLRHRFAAACAGVLVLASMPVACANNGFSEQAGGPGGGQIEADFDLEVNQDLELAYQEVLRIEEVLNGEAFRSLHPDMTVGVSFDDSDGEMMFWPEEPMHPDRQEEMLKWLEDRLPQRSTIQYRFGRQFDRRASQDARWTRVRVEGPDSGVVAELLQQVRAAAERDPAFLEVSDGDTQSREVTVRLDRDAMQRAGVSSQMVLGSIEWNLRGFMVSRFQTARSDVPIIIEYDAPDVPNRAALTDMTIGAPGGSIPLASFATFGGGRTDTYVVRRDGRISDSIGLRTGDDDIRRNYQAVEQLMTQVELPEGYRWTQDGGWEEFQQQSAELKNGLYLALALIFLLMGVLFNSLILPLCAILTVPFGLVGAFWAYKLTDTPIGVLEIMALAVLSGVVVNNGIVLIDRILQYERAGTLREEALLRAVRDRARPVLMTAMTTVCGLLPVALSAPSGDGISFQGLSIGVCAGISVSTVLTLWAVPLLYSLLRSLSEWGAHWFGGQPLAMVPPRLPDAPGGD